MRTLILASMLILIAAPVQADHCVTYSTTFAEFDGSGYYIDLDICPGEGCPTSVWIYEESNGYAGLQRGDEVVDDTCHGMFPADTVIF